MNLQTKLAKAIVAFINARKGDRLAGVTVAAAHSPNALVMPFLSVWVPTAPTHPDFAGLPGANFPQLCTVEFLMKAPMKSDYETTVAVWAAELRDILAYGDDTAETSDGDFDMFFTDLNPGEVLVIRDVTTNEAGDTQSTAMDSTGLSIGMVILSEDFPRGTTITAIDTPGETAIVHFSQGKITTGSTVGVRFAAAPGAQHPASGLYITNVAIEEESESHAGDVRMFHLQLSIVAQGTDPA